MRINRYAKVSAIFIVLALVVGLVASCGGETTVTTTKTATVTQTGAGTTQTVTQTVGAGSTVTITAPGAASTVTVTATAPGAATTVTQTVTKTATGAAVQGQTFKLKAGHGHPKEPNSWVTTMSNYFLAEVKRRVEAETPHKIEFSEFWGGSVAKLGEELEATEAGTLDLTIIIPCFETVKLAPHNVGFYVPFSGGDNYKTSQAYWKLHQQFPELDQTLAKYNIKVLGAGQGGNYNLLTTFPWTNLSDLKGHKVAGVGPNLPWFQGSGVVPVQSNLNEGYTSLQTGVYEGWIMFVTGVVGNKFHELAKYYTFVNFGNAATTIPGINLKVWNSLPAEIQNIMLEVGARFGYEQAKEDDQRELKGLKVMQEAGVNTRYFPAEETAKWMAGLASYPNEKAQECKKADTLWAKAPDMFRQYMKNLEDLGYKWPYKYEILD